MSKEYWALGRNQYYALVDEHVAQLSKELKARWNDGELRKGPCSLFERDFDAERREEYIDSIAYEIMGAEKSKRMEKLK